MVDRLDEIGERRVVSVFGSGEVDQGEPAWQVAYEVGRKLAALGYAVANGGYGGTMAAAAQGAKQAGGAVIGVTCSVWKSSPCDWLDRVITTQSLSRRIQTLIDLGRAGYVVLPGATGTLAELAWVWELSFKGLLAGGNRPIVCMGQFWGPLLEMMAAARAGAPELVALAEGAEELGRYFPQV